MALKNLAFALAVAEGAAGKWNYDEILAWTTLSDPNNQCNGKQQSPIKIATDTVKKAVRHPRLQLNHIDAKNSSCTVELDANAHGYKLTPDPATCTIPTATINSWSDLRHKGETKQRVFKLLQWHIHVPSESLVGLAGKEKYYAGVIHNVFLSDEGELLVFGTMLEGDDNVGSSNLSQLIEKEFKSLVATSGKVQSTTVGKEFTLKDTLPSSTDEYFFWDGSLTTPPCTEIVNWFIGKKALKVPSSLIKSFQAGMKDIKDGQGGACSELGITATNAPFGMDVSSVCTARTPQPLNGRTVFSEPCTESHCTVKLETPGNSAAALAVTAALAYLL